MRASPFQIYGSFILRIALLLMLCSFLFFFALADRDLWSSHEGRAAQNAQTILDDGNLGLPRLFDGSVDMQKPPMYYWLVAALAWLQGVPVDAWTVRLPAALAGTLLVVGMFLFGWKRNRPIAGFLAALILATMMHFTWLARTARIDMVLAFALGASLACFYLAHLASKAGPRFLWLLTAYSAMAMAILLKGPIGLILPLAAIVVFVLSGRALSDRRQEKTWATVLHRYGFWWGIPLTFVIAAPWFLYANAQTSGEFFRVFFWHHNIQRGLGGSETLAEYPWWYYGPQLCVDLLPWSLVLPVAVWYGLRQKILRFDDEARFAVVWALTMFAVLSMAKFKRADYLLPVYPAVALFLGCICERWIVTARHRVRWSTGFGSMVVACVACWAIYLSFILPQHEPQREQHRFASLIESHVPAPTPVIFFRVEDHSLAFHVGRRIDTILEWENINTWASRPGTRYIVMPPECAEKWQQHVHSGRLEFVARNTERSGRHERPLVLFRTVSSPPSLLGGNMILH